jgi:hypothetical protein
VLTNRDLGSRLRVDDNADFVVSHTCRG